MIAKRSSILDVLEEVCDSKKGDFKYFQKFIKDIFVFISEHESIGGDQRASQIKKIIDEKVNGEI